MGVSFDEVQPSKADGKGPVSIDDVGGPKPPPPTTPAARPIGSKVGIGARLEAEHENALMGSAQFTHPSVEDHHKNFLGEAHEDDEGHIGYVGKDGQYVKSNTKKHVVLKDPEDLKYKVYARDKDTDEGPISGRLTGLGRILGMGVVGGSLPLRGTASIANKTLAATKGLEETTGVNVQVPRTATTESWGRQTAARTVAAIPGASGPMEAAAGKMGAGLGAAAEATAELPTGIRATAETAGEAAKAGLEKYVAPSSKGGVLAGRVDEAYNKIDPIMQSAPAKDLANTRAAAQELQSEWEGMKKTGIPKSVEEVLGAITDPKGLDYKSLKNLRTLVGEDVKAASGSDRTAMKRLYRGLSEDMEAMIGGHAGARGQQLWGRAKDYARLAADRTEKIERLLGVRGDEGVFSKIASLAGQTTTADAKMLATVKKALPKEEWAEVTSGVIGRLGRNAEGHFDPNKFMKDYTKMSDRGKDIVFGSKGSNDVRKSIDNIAAIAERWPAASEMAHPSGEVAHLAATAGVFHHGFKALGVVMGARLVSGILSRPTTARSAAKWFQSAEQLRLHPTPATVAAYSNATKVLGTDTAREFREEASDATKWTKDLMKGVSVSAIKSIMSK